MMFNRFIILLFVFLWISGLLSLLPAAELTSQEDLFLRESQKFIIRGVYYLINQNNPDAAENEFRRAIALDQHNWEAYYFLARAYYEQATVMEDIPQLQQSISKAKGLLLRAQELGMTYDKLHPNLLSRLKQEYPKVKPIYEAELFPKKTKIVIETETLNFDIQTSKISAQDAATIVGNFLPEEEIQLECDASYQLEFLPKKPKSIKHLILLGIGLTVWLIR
jgi:tetratricopeptide (TPR) repeat protein